MSTTFDVAGVARELERLRSRPHLRKLALVLPLEAGMRGVAHEYLAEGPPFDPSKCGLESHEVFLTDSEAIFVFGVPHGAETLERILADEEFWGVIASWERVAAGPPRAAEIAYDWHAPA